MKVEDRFTVTGRGTALLGKILCKRLNNGESIIVNGRKHVVSAIIMNNKILKFAETGDSVSVLAKGLDRRDVECGDWIYMEV